MENNEFITQFSWLAPQIISTRRKPVLSFPSTKARNTATPFLSLPPEIRHRIYQYVLTVDVSDEEPWVPVSQEKALARQKVGRFIYVAAGNKYSVLAILETCRQVFVEAFHLYYKQNVLCFKDGLQLFWFLKDIGPARRSQMVAMRCEFDLGATLAVDRSVSDMPMRVVRDLLETCGGLKRLHFVRKSPIWMCDKRPFMRLRGFEEVKIEQLEGLEGNWLWSQQAEKWKKALLRPREGKQDEAIKGWMYRNKRWYELEESEKKAEILKRLETVLKRPRLITPMCLIEGTKITDEDWDNDSEDDEEVDMLHSLYEDQEEWVEVDGETEGE